MKMQGLRCFNKGRGQFVLWASPENTSPLERLARTHNHALILRKLHTDLLCSGSLHDWFALHEPSLLQSTKWSPFCPHATILKVRSFGRGREAKGQASPGARVLDILRPPRVSVQPFAPTTPTTTTTTTIIETTYTESATMVESVTSYASDETALSGEIILYRGRLVEEERKKRKSIEQIVSTREERKGQQRRIRARNSQRSDDQAIDTGRYFGMQIVESFELLAMQGSETQDERGLGGYPVYGRLYLNGRCGVLSCLAPSLLSLRIGSLQTGRTFRSQMGACDATRASPRTAHVRGGVERVASVGTATAP